HARWVRDFRPALDPAADRHGLASHRITRLTKPPVGRLFCCSNLKGETMEFSADIQRWILASEGGYVDHPDDPGGATNMGITIGRLSAWRGRKVTKQEVKNLTRGEALEIYKACYWDVVRGDDLPL